jgi:hypothetical protein
MTAWHKGAKETECHGAKETVQSFDFFVREDRKPRKWFPVGSVE